MRGRIIRPLIALRRQALRDALGAAGLDWVEDPTNRDPKFLRNRIRHELFPLLAASYHADLVPALTRVARLARESVDALDRTAARELGRLGAAHADALTLSRSALAALPAAVAAEVLRQAAARLGSRASATRVGPPRPAPRAGHPSAAPALPARRCRRGGER